ncbi:hypothetical protein FHG87_007555 [Trinorchestia longiramus]|nr:hypothetical protein FHG87_007555 [Trinorchestia longiramus]
MTNPADEIGLKIVARVIIELKYSGCLIEDVFITMTSITLVIIAAASGVPLIVRHRGSGKPPSFNVVGSLNGVFMFGESQGTKVMETKTPLSAITWKTYHDSVRLILLHGEEDAHSAIAKSSSNDGSPDSSVAPAQSCCLLGGLPDQRFLDLLFDSLVLLLSIDALTNITSIERLKKDMKVCYPLLDVLLERCVTDSSWKGAPAMGPGPLFSHLVHCADTVLPPDNYNLQSEVQKWSEVECSSSYSCLLSSCGRVLAGSRSYWSLSRTELVLLPLLLLTTAAPNTARDVPVYLPNKSPKVPFRLLGVKLTGLVWCASVCGPTPSLAQVLHSAAVFWSPYYAGIETLAATQPYNITAAVKQTLDKAVLGLLVINHESKRCVSCVHLGSSGRSQTDAVPPTSSHECNNDTLASSKSRKPSSPLPSYQSSTLSSTGGAHSNTIRSSDGHSNTLRSVGGAHSNTLRSTGGAHSNSSTLRSTGGAHSNSSTLRSNNDVGGGTAVHTYQTAEANITPVTGHTRVLSPSSRPMSPSQTQTPQHTLTRQSRAKSPVSAARAKSPSAASRAKSPDARKRTKSPAAISRAKSPDAGFRMKSPVRATTGKALSGGSSVTTITPAFKMAALASVYRSIAHLFLTSATSDADTTGSVAVEGHSVKESYVWCGACRVYVIKASSLLLLVLLPSALPHPLARSVSYKTLDVFLKSKIPRL